MSEMYRLQSRIASGSQAARCFGVHCCAAAGKDANVSTRPMAVERPVIARRFSRAVRILVPEPPFLPSAPVFTVAMADELTWVAVRGAAVGDRESCNDMSWPGHHRTSADDPCPPARFSSLHSAPLRLRRVGCRRCAAACANSKSSKWPSREVLQHWQDFRSQTSSLAAD